MGVPCDAPGSFTQANVAWGKVVGATTSMLGKLCRLPDGQMRHALLRHCLDACKVNHLMRAVSCEAGTEAIKVLSDALKTAVLDLVGCGLTTGAWEQATLPISKGGLGIRDPVKVWPEARLSAMANFHHGASQ